LVKNIPKRGYIEANDVSKNEVQYFRMSMSSKHYHPENIKAAMSMAQCVDAMAYGFSALYQKKAIVPERMVNVYPAHGCTQLVMPAVLSEKDLLTTKLIAVNPGNKEIGRPLIHGLITAQTASTGEILGTLDGTEITSMRTAAASALATRLFANSHSTVLGIVGTGVQARYHIAAMMAVLPIDKVLVRGTNEQKTASFCDRIKADYGVKCLPTQNFKPAQVVCTCTTSSVPVLSIDDLSRGTHINAVGGFRLSDRELATDIIVAAKVFIDVWAGCLAEAGDVMIPVKEGAITTTHVQGELGYWVDHMQEFKRNSEDITVFKSVGNAVQDAAAVACVLGLL
jgi:ornithine cyclodeaminase/alanine dehydrogenase-like protein (mu-crystallin family)